MTHNDCKAWPGTCGWEDCENANRSIKPRNLAPLMSSAKPDWQTPDCVLERVRRVAPIGLDPCTTKDNPCNAWSYYTPEVNGLQKTWADEMMDWVPGESLIYCNPPYDRGIGAWVDKCREAAKAYQTVIALLPARTDTRWFPWDATAICFWKGRLTFRGAPAPAPFPNAAVFWGNRVTLVDFLYAFQTAGKVIEL